ncbi:MAG: SDR family NAD(P)-dependent oxidoreductase, partial [Alphaproteobacteria bacterium]
PAHQIRPEEWDEVIAVNLTANWRVIRCLDPLLRASDAGRAMFVSSGVSDGRAYWGAYAVSKSALEALVITWAQETEKTNMKINLIQPGAVRTGMRAEAYPGEDPMTLAAPEDITDLFVELAAPSCSHHGEILSVSRR